MDIATRQLLEADNFQIIEGRWDFTYKTNIFILHPDGRLNPYYDYLHQIPFLPNGTEIDLRRTAMPYDNINNRETGVKNSQALTNTAYSADAQGLPIPIIVGYIILSIVLLAIFICLYFILNPGVTPPPCGTAGSITDVSDCVKIIIMPNCDSRVFNSCDNTWLEDDWHKYTPPIGWENAIVLGLIAIGAIILIPKILDFTKPPYQPPQPPHYPPHYPPHPPKKVKK